MTERLTTILQHVNTSCHAFLDTNLCKSPSSNILLTEREKANFDVRKITHLLDGGEMETSIYEAVFAQIEYDPVLNDRNAIFNMSRSERRFDTMQKINHVVQNIVKGQSNAGGDPTSAASVRSKKKDKDNFSASVAMKFWEVMSLYDPSWATKIGVHFGLFQNAIESSGTEEQVLHYMPLIRTMRVYGCFAMTELGHGSYIRGFETTATYDKSRQEFVINSPTQTSTKWWIGAAGQTATHSVVFARLMIDGNDHGIHSFVVQLRDTATGLPLPGISVGDCGSKMGRDGIDNGWIQFDHFRIPRTDMLMRWSQVTPEGEFISPPSAQMSYGALITGRVTMIIDSAKNVQRALTIAIRYSAIRRQFPSKTDEINEEQILNYQTHQYRLMPMLATSYALHVAAQEMSSQYEEFLEELNDQNLESIGVVHSTSAGLKSLSTWWCNESLEIARQCLGGHGFSTYSGLPTVLQDWAVNCTWEGDNTVLAQQTARFLVSSFSKICKGQKLSGFISYLNNYTEVLNHRFTGSIHSSISLESLVDAQKWLATFVISSIGLKMQNIQEFDSDIAWNKCQVDLCTAALIHCHYFILDCFKKAIEKIEDAPVREVLADLCRLYSLYNIDKNMKYFLQGRYFSPDQAAEISDTVFELCSIIREVSVPLVDAFNFPDFLLRSPLGRKDGNLYASYMEMVKQAPENAYKVAPYFEELIKPMVNAQ
eukprot:TRINITY_DN7336_c0_g1_i1.p1 TRINITY_DN7336_c0_g1~~TRINITY_DN7336_c0_g1_i1.p1  ORF type:complete len:719 (+),score=148.75 TRINITY_DN7336_c0_g1_i1:30-2159(+)